MANNGKRFLFFILFAIVLMMASIIQISAATPRTVLSRDQIAASFHKQVLADMDEIILQIQQMESEKEAQKTPLQMTLLDEPPDYNYYCDWYGADGRSSYPVNDPPPYAIDPQWIAGACDGAAAELETPNPNNIQQTVEIIGYTDYAYFGDIRVRLAYKYPDAYEWSNYITLWTSEDGSNWDFSTSPTHEATTTEPYNVGFGSAQGWVNYFGVAVFTQTGYGQKNWVLVDGISIQHSISEGK